MREKLKQQRPDLYLVPDLSHIRVMEFHRGDDIYKKAEPEKSRLKRELEKLIEL